MTSPLCESSRSVEDNGREAGLLTVIGPGPLLLCEHSILRILRSASAPIPTAITAANPELASAAERSLRFGEPIDRTHWQIS